jgi:hypothetical protein
MEVTNLFIVILLIVASVNCQPSTVQKQMEKFSALSAPAGLRCPSNQSTCANSTADRSVSVRSQAQCIHECQHGGERSACVGVNYRQVKNVCEVYNKCPASYNANETGCQYLQVTVQFMVSLLTICAYMYNNCNKRTG